MRCPRALVVPVLTALTVLGSCVEGGTPLDPFAEGATASLAVVPKLPPEMGRLSGPPVNVIRVTVRRVPGNEQVAQTVVEVDPNASEWQIGIEVPLGVAGAQYVLELELMNESGGARTVEWSGRTSAMTLTAGLSPEMRQIGVVRGPLDNLAVTAVVVSGPGTVAEQASFTLTAEVVTSQTGAQPKVYWTSLDPTVASIGSNGRGLGLKPGTARIEATAGPVTVIHNVVVTAVPDAVDLTPASVELSGVGQVATYTARVLDRSGNAIAGAGVTWTVGDSRIARSLGGGQECSHTT